MDTPQGKVVQHPCVNPRCGRYTTNPAFCDACEVAARTAVTVMETFGPQDTVGSGQTVEHMEIPPQPQVQAAQQYAAPLHTPDITSERARLEHMLDKREAPLLGIKLPPTKPAKLAPAPVFKLRPPEPAYVPKPETIVPAPPPPRDYIMDLISHAHEILKTQLYGGDHYVKRGTIQLMEFLHDNEVPFTEGAIIKYVHRWRDKGGVVDLKKAIDSIVKLIAMEDNKIQRALGG